MKQVRKKFLRGTVVILLGLILFGCGAAQSNQLQVTPSATATSAAPTKRVKPTKVPRTPKSEPTTPLTHGPVVGAVTANSARVFVRSYTASSVQLRYGKKSDLSDAVASPIQRTDAATDFTTQFQLENLTPETDYYIDVLVNESSQLTAPYPHFKTFPSTDTSTDFTFVIVGDTSLSSARHPQTFVHAAQEQPAFAIMGGDFPHGKPLTLEKKRHNFKAIYSADTSPSIGDFVNLILRQFPVAHFWDDHDYGPDNSDKTYPQKELSLQILREYFPTYPMTQYGDWQSFRFAQAEFFMLDARSQRDPNWEPNTLSKSMLDGDELGDKGQLVWLKNGLKNSTARWKFIVSPVPFNATSKPTDAWAAFPAERRALVDFIQKNNIQGVVILSGDLHMGGIDDGTNSDFPEMLVNGANGGGCISSKVPGTWSEGTYGKDKQPCNGYGVVRVFTNPDRVLLQIKDDNGQVKLELELK